jgi:hypothetical protein
MLANLRNTPLSSRTVAETPKQPSPGPKVARAISLSRPCELITPTVPGRKSAIRETGLKRWPGVQPARPEGLAVLASRVSASKPEGGALVSRFAHHKAAGEHQVFTTPRSSG